MLQARFYGLDIGSSAVKFAELKRHGEKIILNKASVYELSLDPTKTDHEERLFAVKHAIAEILAKEEAVSGRIGVSIQGQAIFVRFIKIPRVSPNKIRQIVKYEAQQQVPFSIDDVIWDFQIFDKPQDREIEVMVVAVKKDIVEFVKKVLSKSRLNVDFIDASPFACYNAYSYFKKDESIKTVMLLDMGAETTDIIIIDSGRIWTRTVLIGGNDITRVIKDKLGLNFLQAEEVKYKEANIVSEKDKAPSERIRTISQVITPVLEDLLKEISHSIGYYRSQCENPKNLDMLALSGGSSKLAGMDKFFQINLGINTEYFDVMNAMDTSESVRKDASTAHRMNVAIGLAARGLVDCRLNINLLTREELVLKEFRKKKFCIYGIFLMMLLILLTVNYGISKGNCYFKNAFNINKKGAGPLKIVEQRRLENKVNELNKEIDYIVNLQGRNPWPDYITELSNLLLDEIWIKSILLEGDTYVIIKGYTTSTLAAITDFKKRLDGSEYFEQIDILEADLADKEDAEIEARDTSPSGPDKSLKVFSMRAKIQPKRSIWSSN